MAAVTATPGRPGAACHDTIDTKRAPVGMHLQRSRRKPAHDASLPEGRPVVKILISAVVLCGLAAGAAHAGAKAGIANGQNAQRSTAAAPAGAALPAQAKAARLAALVSRGSVILKKNVASVTHLNVGIYCIKPAPEVQIDPLRITPTASVEWGTSNGNGLLAQYYRSPAHCPSGTIEEGL